MLKYVLIFYVVNVLINILIYRLSKNNTEEKEDAVFLYNRSTIPACTFIPLFQTASIIFSLVIYLDYKLHLARVFTYLFEKIFGK